MSLITVISETGAPLLSIVNRFSARGLHYSRVKLPEN
jgi:hypothetical protein